MPLSEHEERILEEMERRLSEEDPRFYRMVGQGNLLTTAARRMRMGVLLFVIGFFMLLLFPVRPWGQWAAVAGFGVMLASALVVYHYLKQLGREQLASIGSRRGVSLTGMLARFTERFRRRSGPPPPTRPDEPTD